jgi:CheY-like chemotaxis protein
MLQHQSILLVEDDKDDQDFFLEALAKVLGEPLLCDVVNNGKEALRSIKQSLELPSLIFMDVNMPMMGGIECLAELKNNTRTKGIPVVMLTTSGFHNEKALQLGAKAFIVKPDNPKALRLKLEEILNGATRISEISC